MNLPVGFGELAERLRRCTVLVGGGRGGTGSGVIVRSEGAIVTNAHVARIADNRVQLWDGRSLPASLKSRDAYNDLALLSVAATGLPVATLGDSRRLRAGEVVVAVGNPFGFLGAVTAGIVHAVGPLSRRDPREWVQSNVRLAPGNSGGPLADASGNVVGVNSMIVGRLGVAVPVNAVRRFLAPAGPRRTLGVSVRPVSVPVGDEDHLGLLVLDVAEGSPAHIASLIPGDIIIGTEDGLLRSFEDLHAVLDGEGEKVVRLSFLRGNRTEVRIASLLLGVRRHRAA